MSRKLLMAANLDLAEKYLSKAKQFGAYIDPYIYD